LKDPHDISILQKLRDPIANAIGKTGISPDALSMIGLIVGMGSGVLLGYGMFFYAFITLLIASIADAIDGAIARAKNIASVRGAFMDSTMDRFVDGVIFGGLVIYYARLDDLLMVGVTLAALIGALTTSYAAARAQSLGVSKYVGPMSRFHRVVLILLGTLVPQILHYCIILLAILGVVTALNRTWVYSGMLKDKE